MRSLRFALLALGLTSCTQTDAPIDEDDYPSTDADEEVVDDVEDETDDGIVPGRDAGRRDAGARDAGRRDAGRPLDAGSFFPFEDGSLFPGLFGDAFVPPPPPAPPRLSLLLKSQRPLPALSGGTLAVRGAGDIAVAADPDRDRIYVVTLDGSKPPQVIELEPGSEPGRVAIDSRGRAHVALRSAGQVVTLDLASATVLARTALCALPRGLAYDAAQDALVVACASGELVTVAAATHQGIATTQLALDLRDVVVEADGSRTVSRYRSAELLRVSASGQLLSTKQPHPRTQSLGNTFEQLPNGGLVDKGPQIVSSSPALAWRTVASADDNILMLHQQSRDSEIDLGTDGGTGASYGGGCTTITAAALTLFGRDGSVSAAFPIAPHGLVVDVAISADGRFVALAEPGSYLRALPTLEVLDIASFGGLTNTQSVGGGAFPDGCVGGWQGAADGQVTAVAFDDSGRLYAFSREPASLQVFDSSDPQFGFAPLPQREFALALESVRDTGHELFHADVGSGLSCAGCHGEALDDGHVWNFKDFGARRTQTMRGGLLNTLPLHWEGDLGTFQNLIDEVMTRRMGGFKVEPKFGEALADWLHKLPPLKLGRVEDDAALRGKLLFDSAEVGCASCHGGTQFTNNTSANVGTGGLFQVPTLLGVALHPPFMHDGCADTLEARFEPSCGGGDAHGHTSQLTLAQIADLVAYLKTL